MEFQHNQTNQLESIICDPELKSKLKSILFTEEQIESRLNELAKQITNDYSGKKNY